MRHYPWMIMLAAGSLLVTVACTSEEEFKRVQQEVGDLKVEVFKMRMAAEEAIRKAEADRTATAEARTLDRRFQADLQETLRLLQDSTRALSNRMKEPPQQPRRTGSSDTTTPAAPTPVQSEDEKAFNAAVLDYNRGNYALAAESLGLFIKSYPQSARSSDALFFLGLCHYNQKAYDKAQTVFEQILKDFSSTTQFLPAKLKRSQCMLKQNLKAAALVGFREIVDSFPGTPEARTAQQELADLNQ